MYDYRVVSGNGDLLAESNNEERAKLAAHHFRVGGLACRVEYAGKENREPVNALKRLLLDIALTR